MSARFNHLKADAHWQAVWEEQGTFRADDASVQAATAQKLEDIILTKARDLRRATVAG